MSEQLPSIVILGRPNVGKSTLFNRLTGTRRSIVTNEPGITRDRIYGTAEWRGRRFEVVDTGGIIPDEQAGIPGEILRQARMAIDRAAHLLLVVDARDGVTPLDLEMAQLLRRTGKPLAVAANKVDTAQQASLSAEFHKLSKHIFGISAEHGLGVDDLLDYVIGDADAAPDLDAGRLEAGDTVRLRRTETSDEIRVAIIGRPNVGKSTLLNRLVGAERAIVSPIPGTTRDAVDTMVEHGGTRYRLVDTAGIRRKGKTKLIAEKLSVVMARRHLEQTDVALCVIDASQGVTSNDATIASYAQQSGRACIVVMNKFDLAVQLAAEKSATEAHRRREESGKKAKGAQKTARNVRHERARLETSRGRAAHAGPHAPLLHDYEKIVRAKLKFLDYAPVVFLSAKTGERTETLFALINRVAAAHRRRVTTGELNRWMEKVDLERGTSPSGRKVKIYYVTQAATAPPTFVLFTNQARPLHFSYERFLDNQLRAHFDFTGTPIRFNQRLKKR